MESIEIYLNLLSRGVVWFLVSVAILGYISAIIAGLQSKFIPGLAKLSFSTGCTLAAFYFYQHYVLNRPLSVWYFGIGLILTLPLRTLYRMRKGGVKNHGN